MSPRFSRDTILTNAQIAKLVKELEQRIDFLCEQNAEKSGTIKFKGVKPTLATEGSGGFDLYANGNYEVYPGQSFIAGTGTYVEIPENFVGLVKCRSGVGFKKDCDVFQGVIDSDYRGEIKVKLFNYGNDVVRVKRGERFAQLVITRALTNPCIFTEELTETERGGEGFGSTGK